jgi:glyoxylase-like metal-dependent hydrolase (beta-lactamase superfamily II)
MANPRRRHPENVDGPWFVDDTCIDCDASRQCAPWMFGHGGNQAVVIRQPATDAETRDAVRAMLACPTGSIGVIGAKPSVEGVYPEEIEPDTGVFYCGYNSPDSYGANAYFAVRPGGNLMVDAPRFVAPLERAIAARGGLAHILLTHQDDVADAQRWADRFGARVWIHDDDRHAAPFATDLVRGTDPVELVPGLLAVPVPGHTRGSLLFLLDHRYLFTGDSLHWSRSARTLTGFEHLTWYSWPEQLRSLARFAAPGLLFEWVLPGHGTRHQAPAHEMRASLAAFLARTRAGSEPEGDG